MSMQEHSTTTTDQCDEHDEEEAWIEAEIERELKSLDLTDLDDVKDDDDPPSLHTTHDGEDESQEEMSRHMQDYVRHMQEQTERLEKDLEECDHLLQETDQIVSTPRPYQQDLMDLAMERGEDVAAMKKKVLEDLEREDMEDERMKLESVNEQDLEVNVQLKEDAKTPTTDSPELGGSGEGQPGDVEGTCSAFLTAPEETKPSEEEEYQELRRKILGEPDKETEEHDEEEGSENEDEGEVDDEGTLGPGEGVLMAHIDPIALEQKITREVLDWEDNWLKKNQRREEEVKRWTEEETVKMEEEAAKRENELKNVKQQQEDLQRQQEEEDEKILKESKDAQQQIEESLNKYQVEFKEISESVRQESEALKQAKDNSVKQEEEKRHESAIKIQAQYRGYRVYKTEGKRVKEHLDEWKEQKTQARIAALEESRKKKAEERKRREGEEIAREEYKKKKEEEKNRLEEEKKRAAEEKKRKDEDEQRKKVEEEEKRKEEEDQRKLKEEQQRKEEEIRREEEKRLEKLRKEAEEKKKEEESLKREEEERLLEEKRQKEEKKRKMVEEQMKAAEEKRLKELQEKQEEEERRLLEEKKKEEAKRKKEDEDRKKKEAEEDKLKNMGLEKIHSPVPPEGRPKTPRKKVNELRKSAMSPLANGARSPSQDEDSKSPPKQSGNESRSELKQSVKLSQSEPKQSVRMSRTEMVNVSQSESVSASHVATPRSARTDLAMVLPERIEKQRLEWIQKCQPWSKTAQNMKTKKAGANRQPLRRPISAKNVSSLLESTVLQAAGVTSLQQVTTVELQDLPGCSLKLLGQCPRLKALRIHNSGIISTEGIELCKELAYLDLKNNSLEALTLRDHPRLMYVDLSHNSLTSLLGLEGCVALRYVNASHNRLTRISGLEGLTSLYTLDLSHNQLITVRGLSAAPTVQHLNLSHNHLPSLDDIHPLGLLQVLQVSGNNILQPPLLNNHVLLRTLMFDDNSLCSLHNLSLSWLPLLSHLQISQNNLSSLEDMGNCLNLQELDVSTNQINEVESLTRGLRQCCHLQKIKTEGNPVTEETDFRSKVFQILPWLQKVDNSKGSSTSCRETITDYENMCQEQITVWEKMAEDFKRKTSKYRDLGQLAAVHLQYYKQSHQLAVDHRYKHEYGDTVAMTEAQTHPEPDIDLDLDLKPGVTTNSPSQLEVSEASMMKNKFEVALQNMNGSNSVPAHVLPTVAPQSAASNMANSSKKGSKFGGASQKKTDGAPLEHIAAVRIQALWRGYSLRRDIEQHSRWWLAATTIQAAWRGHFVRKVLEEMGYNLKQGGAWRHDAATKIQALWRGYRLRKRIEYALNYAKTTFDDTDDLDDEMNFKEVDLSAFDFNEDDLEKGWNPPETPQIPAKTKRDEFNRSSLSHVALNSVPSASGQQALSAKAAFDAVLGRPPHPPQQPRQAWRNMDSPMSDVPYGSVRRPPLPPVSRLSDYSGTGTENTGSTTHRTHRSKKEELTEEWGFKDSKTAELMMKRAKKLHYNSQRKKKLNELDPKQRLALFRKLEDASHHKPVQAPLKKVLPRKEYFQAREDAVRHQDEEKQKNRTDTNQRCFEWVHTQVGSYDVGTSRINQRLSDAAIYNNENLPQMDPNVIAGARPTLTGSPMSMELQSLDGISTAGDLQRRHHSAGDSASRLPPIQVGTAPATQSKSDHPERMSFRNPKPKTLESIGWGGGKKRSGRR